MCLNQNTEIKNFSSMVVTYIVHIKHFIYVSQQHLPIYCTSHTTIMHLICLCWGKQALKWAYSQMYDTVNPKIVCNKEFVEDKMMGEIT